MVKFESRLVIASNDIVDCNNNADSSMLKLRMVIASNNIVNHNYEIASDARRRNNNSNESLAKRPPAKCSAKKMKRH